MLRTLAFYLPQFHRVPENDEWWGEGFTDWIAVKRAEKLFEGHNQPRVPLNNNYYNLLEHDTMAWQAELMKKYRVDGMCIYHYWFENGRRILEKPAENLLKWNDIQMPFCFYWANRTWVRTWEKLTNASVWSAAYETPKRQNETGILLRQSYGREKDWEEHFLYLLPFFLDERYIKLNNRPIFVIYKPNDIFSLWDMAEYFDRRARQSGFEGIYFIGSEGEIIQGLNAAFERKPDSRSTSYDEMWEMTLNSKLEKGNKTYFCGGVDFDNSPRMGKDGFIIKGASPQKFYKYFKRLYKKSMLLDNEFIFINAWNEWGEGMYLEPDEKYRYGYLESIQRVVEECENETLKGETEDIPIYYDAEETIFLKKKMKNLLRYNTLVNNWLCLKERRIDFSLYFNRYGYQNIAIYGMGRLGMHLLYELHESSVKVSCGIDENNERIECEVDVYNPKQKIPKIDAVVITITDQYSEISRRLRKNIDCPMITIEEVVQELMLQ